MLATILDGEKVFLKKIEVETNEAASAGGDWNGSFILRSGEDIKKGRYRIRLEDGGSGGIEIGHHYFEENLPTHHQFQGVSELT
jgi:hypothetical protein